MDILESFIALTPLQRMRRRKEFANALFAAVSDGRLTEEEIRAIEHMRDRAGMTEDDIRPLRVQLYAAAYKAVAGDERVTEEEWTEMLKIQQFLGIEDRDVVKTKKSLLRLHLLQELRAGNLPLLPSPSGFAAARGEQVHWTSKGTLTKRDAQSPSELIITDRRIVLRGEIPESIRIGKVTDIAKTEYGLRIAYGTDAAVEFLPRDHGDIRLVRMLLEKVLRARQA